MGNCAKCQGIIIASEPGPFEGHYTRLGLLHNHCFDELNQKSQDQEKIRLLEKRIEGLEAKLDQNSRRRRNNNGS